LRFVAYSTKLFMNASRFKDYDSFLLIQSEKKTKNSLST